MATKIGPKTVTQRDRSKQLVFCIDAANSDSYGGEPTTNLAPPDLASWGTEGTAVRTDAGYNFQGQPVYKCRTEVGASWKGIDRTISGLRTAASGSTVCMSIWVKNPNPSSYNFTAYIGHDFSSTRTLAANSGWQKIEWTVSEGSMANDYVEYRPYTNSADRYIHMTMPQVEVKAVSTPFTATSRTASNAVKNISGVGALGTTLTGTFAAYGQQLYKPTDRNVLATLDSNQGHIGGAFWDFDGSDECIVIPYDDNSSLNLTRGTIIAWFNASGGAQNGTIVGWGSAGTDNYGNIAITSNWTGGYADESLAYNRWRSGVTSQIQMYIRKGHNFYADSTWHCVAVTSHGGASDLGRIYIDGELQTITTTSNTGGSHPFMNLKDSTAKFLNIGRRPYGGGINYFNGEIANTMIWSSSLTSKEIKDIYIAQKGRFGK